MDQGNQAPLPLRIITLLGIIGAAIKVLASLSLLVLGFGSLFFTIAAIGLAKYGFALVSFVALRKMKKWAFYLFGIVAITSLISLAYSQSNSQIAETLFSVVFFGYLWTLRQKFV